MKPCVWCHRRSRPLRGVTVTLWGYFAVRRYEQTFAVHPEHEAAFCAYVARFQRHGRLFFALAGALALCLVGVILATSICPFETRTVLAFNGMLVASGGALLVAFPFCTPRQVHGISLQGARQLLRVVGGLDLALGTVLATLSALL